MVNLSAIVLAKNEESRIGKCLESLRFVDEIIVVDNGSVDATVEIAKKRGATVVKNNGRDFAKLRNIGKGKAHGQWLLYVDADEIVTDELAKEIQSVMRPPDSYTIRRRNVYMGQPWPYEERILRLFHRSSLKEWYGVLHESPRIEGEVGELRAPLMHDTHRTLEEMVRKTNEWSGVEANLRYDAGHPPVVWWRFPRVMLSAFFDTFVHQGGWRAGVVGWIESIFQSFSIFITYAKLWEMQKNKKTPLRGKQHE